MMPTRTNVPGPGVSGCGAGFRNRPGFTTNTTAHAINAVPKTPRRKSSSRRFASQAPRAPPTQVGNAIRATTDWNGIYWELFVFIGLLFFICCFSMGRYSLYLEKKLQREHR